MSQPLLEIAALRVAFGDRVVLDDLSLTLAAGECLGLVGESGSGKSMTALSILRLLPEGASLSGAIRFAGRDLAPLDEPALCSLRGRAIGMVFQEPMTALDPLMTIGDQVAETVRIHERVSRIDAAARAKAALESVGLGAIQPGRYPHQLSGGQRQRVAIAIATVLKPALILADEPTTALDVTTQAGILELLRTLCRENGSALILITHDLGVVAQMADRIAILKDGRLVEQGLAAAILSAPATDYARRLVAAAQPRRARTVPGAKADAPLLDVEGLVRAYPGPHRHPFAKPAEFRAVDGVSFAIAPGEQVGLVGESGSGKSTLLRAILALEPPEAGRVRLDGQDFGRASGAGLRRLRRGAQAVFQDPYGSFDPRHRVARIVAEPLHLLDDPPQGTERRRLVEAWLGRVGLPAEAADRFPHEFSGGQRQRIAIARALIIEPRLVVLDEAVSALDVTVRAQILDLLAELAAGLGVATLFVSHDLHVVRAVTDRVLVMREGRIVEEGPTEQVFQSPRHPYTATLLAATPGLRGSIEALELPSPLEGEVGNAQR